MLVYLLTCSSSMTFCMGAVSFSADQLSSLKLTGQYASGQAGQGTQGSFI
jgi:hypothetical protein